MASAFNEDIDVVTIDDNEDDTDVSDVDSETEPEPELSPVKPAKSRSASKLKASEHSPDQLTQPLRPVQTIGSHQGPHSSSGADRVRKKSTSKAVKVKDLKTKSVGLKSKQVGKISIKKKPEQVDAKAKKKSTEKLAPNSGTEKCYTDFSPILDGYADILEHLNPDDPNSEVDKVVKFILDKNIQVRHINVLLLRFGKNLGSEANCLKRFPLAKFGRFTDGDFGENGSIRRRWEELVKKVPICDPATCIEDFSQITIKLGRTECKKRNVLGCYLGQDLRNVRHACDVFRNACRFLRPFMTGKFSQDEDRIILAEVEKSGPSSDTWKNLARVLNRKQTNIILDRYRLLLRGKSTGWLRSTLAEDEIIFESLFAGTKGCSVETIQSVNSNQMIVAAERLGRDKRFVLKRWLGILKPILISYHIGSLHHSWRESFYNYLVEKKVVGIQDLDYKELTRLFPEQNSVSLNKALSVFLLMRDFKKIPLYQIIQDKLPTLKCRQETEKARNFREEIVKIYEKVQHRS